jgi:mannose-1-phosphate guanylyltransferase
MLQEAQSRLEPLIPIERVYVATNREHVSAVADQLPGLPPGNVLAEPAARGTAAAIGLAAVHLRQRDPGATMVVVTADHLIARRDIFRDVIAAAAQVAADGWLVTLGIEPSYPETGYGYVERGDELAIVDGFRAYRVARFVEKPQLATAEEYVRSGTYSWNSGIFIWTVECILDEMARHLPRLANGLAQIASSLGGPEADATFEEVWQGLPNETIDYGIMEKAKRVAVLPVDIGWSDVGSWAAVLDVSPRDDQGNVVVGTHVSPDTVNSLIYSPRRLVATIGLEEMIVVDTGDVLLVCPRSRAQDVRQVVAMLRKDGLWDYL